jgi:hypothetical protein
MTTEEKAKAYDEALERAEIAYKDTDKHIKATIERIFPKLRESEDKRIGSVIYCIIRDNKEVKRILEGNGVSVDNALSYLEKQKEQKPNFDTHWENGSMMCMQKEQKPVNHKFTTWHRDVVYCAMCNKNLDEGLRCNLEVVYKTIKELVDRTPVVEEQKLTATINGEPIPTENLSVNIPLVEWSGEDEKMRNLAIEWAETMSGQCSFVNMNPTDFRKIATWLKFLRPSWKPSDEQMEALNFAITYFIHDTSYKNPTELRELYDDLLKLK